MASVGELFKFLGSNDFFQGLCKDSEKTNQQIIESIFQNDEVITTLRNFVQDDTIIKSKMEVLIGQKRKSQNKKLEQVKIQTTEEEEEEKKIQEFKFLPINKDKVIYLDNFAYIEQVDHRLRLVTHDYEMFY